MKTVVVDDVQYQYEVITEGLMSKLMIKKGIVVFLNFTFIDDGKRDFEEMAIDFIKNVHQYSDKYKIHLY